MSVLDLPDLDLPVLDASDFDLPDTAACLPFRPSGAMGLLRAGVRAVEKSESAAMKSAAGPGLDQDARGVLCRSWRPSLVPPRTTTARTHPERSWGVYLHTVKIGCRRPGTWPGCSPTDVLIPAGHRKLDINVDQAHDGNVAGTPGPRRGPRIILWPRPG